MYFDVSFDLRGGLKPPPRIYIAYSIDGGPRIELKGNPFNGRELGSGGGIGMFRIPEEVILPENSKEIQVFVTTECGNCAGWKTCGTISLEDIQEGERGRYASLNNCENT